MSFLSQKFKLIAKVSPEIYFIWSVLRFSKNQFFVKNSRFWRLHAKIWIFWLLLKNLETLAALLSLHDNNQLELRSSCPWNEAPASSLTTGPIKPLLVFFILMAPVGNGV